jgi:hypothetical protein
MYFFTNMGDFHFGHFWTFLQKGRFFIFPRHFEKYMKNLYFGEKSPFVRKTYRNNLLFWENSNNSLSKST